MGSSGKNEDDPQSSGDLGTADLDAAAEGRRPLVLVIDDDADIRTAIQDLLDGEGFATIGSADGQAALHLLADLPVRPAVILLDLMMPIVDGWTFCKIRQGIVTLMEIPVITISAASTDGTSAPLRVDGSIKKPFDADALIEMVNQMVGRKSFRGRTPAAAREYASLTRRYSGWSRGVHCSCSLQRGAHQKLRCFSSPGAPQTSHVRIDSSGSTIRFKPKPVKQLTFRLPLKPLLCVTTRHHKRG